MAKSSFPVMKSGGGVLGKLVGWVVTLGVLAFIVQHPAEAAQLLSSAIGMLEKAVEGVAAFFGQIHG